MNTNVKKTLNTDSTETGMNSVTGTLDRIESLLELSRLVKVSDLPTAIQYAKEAAVLSSTHGHMLEFAKAELELGLLYMITGENKLSFGHTESALNYFQKEGQDFGRAEAYYIIGSIYCKMAHYALSMEYLLKSLKIWLELRDKRGESRALRTIASIYESFGDRENAIQTYRKCMEISTSTGDINEYSNACNPLAGIYLKQNKIKEALKIINESIKLKKETKDRRGLAFALYGKGKIFQRTGNHKKAEPYLLKSLMLHKHFGEGLGIAMSESTLGKLYFEKNKLDRSREYHQQALYIGKTMGNKAIMFKAHYNLYRIAKADNDPRKALEHLEIHNRLKDIVIRQAATKIKSRKSKLKVASLGKEVMNESHGNKSTNEKNLELDNINRELKIANATKDRFFSIVAHDLKNPMHSIIGLTNALKTNFNHLDKVEIETFVDHLYVTANNMLKLTQNLLDWSRLQSDSIICRPEKLQLSDAFGANLILLKQFAELKNITFSVQFRDDSVIVADRNMVISILGNLSYNAIKFTEEGGEVQISSSAIPGYEKISVRDNGVGMSTKCVSEIFDASKKQPTKGTANEAGTGLGLMLCKEFIEKNGGQLEIDSEEGKGSRFIFTLPTM